MFFLYNWLLMIFSSLRKLCLLYKFFCYLLVQLLLVIFVRCTWCTFAFTLFSFWDFLLSCSLFDLLTRFIDDSVCWWCWKRLQLDRLGLIDCLLRQVVANLCLTFFGYIWAVIESKKIVYLLIKLFKKICLMFCVFLVLLNKIFHANVN